MKKKIDNKETGKTKTSKKKTDKKEYSFSEQEKDERSRAMPALITSIVVLLFALIMFKPFSSDFARIDTLLFDAKQKGEEGKFVDALRKLDKASKIVDNLDKNVPSKEKEKRAGIRLRKRKIESLRRKILDAQARLKLKNSAKINKLLKRVKQDEEIGLYKRALDKLDKALDLLDEMEKNKPKGKRAQDVWKKKLDKVRDRINKLRKRLAYKIKKDENSSIDNNKDAGKYTKMIKDLQRKLDESNQRDRQRLKKQLDDMKKRLREKKLNDKKRLAEKKRLEEKRKRAELKRLADLKKKKLLKAKDVKTGVKDIKTKAKNKDDYNQDEGLEKD